MADERPPWEDALEAWRKANRHRSDELDAALAGPVVVEAEPPPPVEPVQIELIDRVERLDDYELVLPGATILLSDREMGAAQRIGQQRQVRREKAGHQNAHGSNGGADDHAQGVMGEIGFAKLTNRYPSGLFGELADDDDVGGIQVRCRRQSFMDLYIWLTDSRTSLWALLTGEGPLLTFHGVIEGRDACVPAYWREKADPFPRVDCWVPPKSALRPIKRLRP
jgi:hypothetical protein